MLERVVGVIPAEVLLTESLMCCVATEENSIVWLAVPEAAVAVK